MLDNSSQSPPVNAGRGSQSEVERNFWTIYHVFVLISALVGQSSILVASLKYRAVKLRPVIVTFIEQMAVCDFLLAITWVLPGTVSLVTGHWVLGEVFCYVKVYFSGYLYQVTSALLVLCTACKFVILRFPLKGQVLFSEHRKKLGIPIWVISAIIPIGYLIVDRSDVSFNYSVLTCEYNFSSENFEKWGYLIAYFMGFLNLILNFSLLVFTVSILHFLISARSVSQRTGRTSLRKQGMITVLLTAFVFLLTNIPSFVNRVLVTTRLYEEDELSFLNRVGKNYFPMLIICANFYIYLYSVRSFNEFVVMRFCTWYKKDRRVIEVAEIRRFPRDKVSKCAISST